MLLFALQFREVAEWLKAHAWKACIRQRIEGSNPFLSAKGNPASKDAGFLFLRKTPSRRLEVVFLKIKISNAFLWYLQGFYACSRFLSGVNEVNSLILVLEWIAKKIEYGFLVFCAFK